MENKAREKATQKAAEKVTEIVTMKCLPNIEREAFIEIVDDLERSFHMRQAGYIDTELLYDGKEDSWIMIQHWESEAQMKASSKEMFCDRATECFRNAIDPRQIQISAYPVSASWCIRQDQQ